MNGWTWTGYRHSYPARYRPVLGPISRFEKRLTLTAVPQKNLGFSDGAKTSELRVMSKIVIRGMSYQLH